MVAQQPKSVHSQAFAHKIRLVTAASLFDGHDAAINLMRRLMQASGAEVIHLGHNRSVAEIVDCAIQEDVQGIAVTSYQGGHLEFFKYMYDLLHERGAGHIKIFGGGGGTILPTEIEELHAYGITRIYSPDDGRAMGLQGMIDDLLHQCDFAPPTPDQQAAELSPVESDTIARLITTAENHPEQFAQPLHHSITQYAPVLGITGTGGAGKSSLVDELVLRFLRQYPDKTLAILSVDPSKRKTGGALLGDRIRMNAIQSPRVYMRSLATRQSNLALSRHVQDAINVCKAAHFDLIIVETSGIGQSDTEITEHADKTLYVMTAEYGAATQLEKIDMLDFADVIAINKFDKRGSLDALRDVRKQYRRNHNLWDIADDDLPILGTVASQFNDPGMNALFDRLMGLVGMGQGEGSMKQSDGNKPPLAPTTPSSQHPTPSTTPQAIIPPDRVRYLAEIVEESRRYDAFVQEQTTLARQLYQIHGTLTLLPDGAIKDELQKLYTVLDARLHPDSRALLTQWPILQQRYTADFYEYTVRDKVIRQPLYSETLSHLKIPKVSLPKYHDWGDVLRWLLTENVPGEFPYAAGVFPLKREGEDPTRMFAGEGGPERTNRRFHYVSKGLPAKRLSTAFDSVTLYGEDPAMRPDIFGKIGNSGVSICTLDDAKKLYSGFDLCDPATSVSMTINGPAPMLLGFFLNAAIDQQCEKWLLNQERGVSREEREWLHTNQDASALLTANSPLLIPSYNGPLPEGNDGLGLLLLGTTGDKVLPKEVYEKIKADTLRRVRGTVQADILKEDQAQNTCIFSTEFALKMMGDIQQYFTDNRVQNFYSVSISGYHIAEAGANPISQLAFTLSNGFTFVEYYLSRGMHIDNFAPNLSFFFSNGMDPEYTVLGRVARRIWAKAMKHKYKANDRSQKLKYHIQTSGRSLHAQEIAFNDIRTTLQALLAIYDNCNSLHTNAYDEAITTPTEESVRRAMAIQLIINREFGLTKNENPLQGAFVVDELTDLVEEAVYQEFLAINERGGVLGAMERMYQRSKIQEESMYYETLKHNGQLPIVGVNTFLDPAGSPTVIPREVIRSTDEEKRYAVESCQAFQKKHQAEAAVALTNLQTTALTNGNLFESLMEATKVCSLGQLSNALYAVGGQYRRNM
ncbi:MULTISPECIES: methylmalonyl-CoA mutase family protein [unclassified Spirosoma]|uniref:methylmalonyl-CoA mutase family protein n=1 Tax=unclassified Spirosoma TaxID=2621999 RepID=UPI000965C7B0|nr:MULTISPECIES: methylmalonyl-CoA mutase family protein [unclassified Spirosoma]MBN8826515.1 methylmalonyl-CoA mutase family protein [Spirosoma sp.]OJW76396.1 MAG: methylmalonyl-CoA mutase [Spirosoma sp. 48-14]